MTDDIADRQSSLDSANRPADARDSGLLKMRTFNSSVDGLLSGGPRRSPDTGRRALFEPVWDLRHGGSVVAFGSRVAALVLAVLESEQICASTWQARVRFLVERTLIPSDIPAPSMVANGSKHIVKSPNADYLG